MTEGSLTKAALVEHVAHVAGLTKKCAEIIVDTVFGNIVAALHQGEKVELRGFGSFRLRRREPRRGRNPRTGDRVDMPPKRVPYFKPGKELKELINRSRHRPCRRCPSRPASNRNPVRGGTSVGRFQRTRLDSLCERRVRLVMAGLDVAGLDDRCLDAPEHVCPGTASGRVSATRRPSRPTTRGR